MRSKENVFISMTLAYENPRFFSDSQTLLIILGIVVSVVGNLVVISLYKAYEYINFMGTLAFLIPMVVILIYFPLLFIRKFGIKEEALKKLYLDMKKYEISDVTPFWDIFYIDKTKIMYIDGSVGVLLKCEKGSIIGRQDTHEDTHFQKQSDFIRQFLGYGYTVDYYSIETIDANTGPLVHTEQQIRKIDNPAIHKIGNEFIRYAREIEQVAGIGPGDYFLIRAKAVDQIVNFDRIIGEAVDITKGSLFSEVEVLNKREIFTFIEIYFGILHMDIQTLMNLKFEGYEKQLVKVVKIFQNNGVVSTPVQVKIKSDRYADVDDFENMIQEYEQAGSIKKKESKVSQAVAPIAVKSVDSKDSGDYGEDFDL